MIDVVTRSIIRAATRRRQIERDLCGHAIYNTRRHEMAADCARPTCLWRGGMGRTKLVRGVWRHAVLVAQLIQPHEAHA